MPASVALVSLRVFVPALVALTPNQPVGKEGVTLWAVLLVDDLLRCLSFLAQGVEDIVSDIGVFLGRGGGPSKFVEVAIEPLVNFGVDGVVIIADLLWSLVLLACFGFCGGSILVCTANIDGVVACESSESGIHVSRQYAADDIPEVRHVVDVW